MANDSTIKKWQLRRELEHAVNETISHLERNPEANSNAALRANLSRAVQINAFQTGEDYDHIVNPNGREPIPWYRRWIGAERKAWQWYSTAGVYDSKTFHSASVYSTQNLRASAYQDIGQRNSFYDWTDNQVSSNSRWFGAAEIVTRWNAVGAADNINAWYLDGYAEKFLQAGNKYLFSFNMENAKSLINTGGLSGCFTDANGAIVSFDGLAGKSLDYAMVQFEQNKVQNFISQYQQDNPNANIDDIIETINGSFSAFGAPSEIKKVMNDYFNPNNEQEAFDFGNYEHRVLLGKKIVDQLY